MCAGGGGRASANVEGGSEALASARAACETRGRGCPVRAETPRRESPAVVHSAGGSTRETNCFARRRKHVERCDGNQRHSAEYVAAVNAGDVNAYGGTLTQDVVFMPPDSPKLTGKVQSSLG